MTLDDAIALAVQVHRGQLDQAGEPYILHPLRVMLAMTTDEARIVGALHDVVEDSNVKIASELLSWMRNEPVICAAVSAISRWEGEPYPDYIERVAANPLATTVKLADLRDNLDRARLERLDEKTRIRLTAKYAHAHERLLAVGR